MNQKIIKKWDPRSKLRGIEPIGHPLKKRRLYGTAASCGELTKERLKIGLLILLVTAVVVFFALDLKQYATLDYIKSQQDVIQAYYDNHSILVMAIFGSAYVLVTAFSLPSATVLTLLGGVLFGFATGLIIVSFASSIGATLAFLMARFLLKDSIQKKYGKHLTKINEGFASEGIFYLFALRLTPVVPFFIVNIVTAMLPIKTWTFYWVSQVGMLAGTAVYVYAGTELSKISALSDIASPTLILSLMLLGIFPLIAKKIVWTIRRRQTNEQV